MAVTVIESYIPPLNLKKVFIMSSLSPLDKVVPATAIEIPSVSITVVGNDIHLSATREMLFEMSYNRIFITDENKNLQIGLKTKETTPTKNIIIDLNLKICQTHTIGAYIQCNS